MKKKLLTILLTAALFFSAVALGISSVFRVDTLYLSASVVTEEGRAQAEEIQAGLQAAYKRKNVFTLDSTQAEEFLKDYPYFRLIRFEKNYPDGLSIELKEESETYAVGQADGNYRILGDGGVIVDVRQTPNGKQDGEPLVLLQGVEATGEKGTIPIEPTFQTALAFCRSVDGALGGIRTNTLSVEVVAGETPYLFVRMREGVTLYIYNPEKMTSEKGVAAVDAYLSLSDVERTKGKIVVDGMITADARYEE